LLVGILLACAAQSSFAQTWVIASASARAQAGARFEIVVVAPAGEPLPDALPVRLRADVAEVDLTMKAAGPAENGRRAYAATMPAFAGGPVTLQLVERPSNTLALLVSRGDAVQTTLAGFAVVDDAEPPLSENEPMYFIAGTRGPTTARFQISLKYRLFDATSGFGRDQPWLSGLYFGYTQNSLWDLSTESKAFRDTSYRPSLFWKWERPDRSAFFDGARLGLEHESNGGEGSESRSINIAFVRPEWHWKLAGGARLEFTPKLYSYLDKEENTDIDDYRGYADWRVRYDSGNLWIATAVLRYGTAGKGSVQVDLSRRTRDLKFGPVSGYLHIQFFAGYGEDIVNYNVRGKSQLRIGFAIVP
jgi:outer membrane phospholipase A